MKSSSIKAPIQKHLGTTPVIAISSGDPGGIGPEIITKALNNLQKISKKKKKSIDLPWDFVPIIIGDAVYFEKLLDSMQDYIKIMKGGFEEGKKGAFDVLIRSGKGIFVDLGSKFSKIVIGKENPENARASYEYFNQGAAFVKSGLAQGLVTGPLNKGAIANIGIPFTGHTEELKRISDNINGKDCQPAMLMYCSTIRVLLLTTHLPISQVAKRLSIVKSLSAIRASKNFLQIIDGKEPKIALMGVDPHAGDQGAIGTIDQEFSIPLIKALRKKRVKIQGPFSADSFFMGSGPRDYTLIVSAYHDQGLIPFKMLCFKKGVNVTLNLSLKRTSPAHGTAFDIAGKNIADSESMEEAIKFCNKWIASEKNK